MNSLLLKTEINKILEDSLIEFGSTERRERELTLTFSKAGNSKQLLDELIEKDWMATSVDQPMTKTWYDRDRTYLRFIDLNSKELFLNYLNSRSENSHKASRLKENLLPVNSDGHTLIRRQVTLMLRGIHGAISLKLVKSLLTKYGSDLCQFNFISESDDDCLDKGKRRMPNVLVKVNSEGFRTVFDTLNGVIPYYNRETNVRGQLHATIFCKPWVCNKCYFVGFKHKCPGKRCAMCGSKQHTTTNCKSNVRICSNCKQVGHRPRDAECPIFLKEVIRMVKQLDIPIEYLEDDRKRLILVRLLHYD